jgi:2,3-dihydroxybenzoate-AMP ligase
MTFGDMLDKAADVYPGKEALVDDRVRLNYSGLRDRVNQLAIGLLNLGISQGDTVLLQLPNWAEFIYSFFALQKIGSIPVLLIPGYRQFEVGHLARLTEAKAWIVPDTYRKIDYPSIIADVKTSNPQLEHVISVRASNTSHQFSSSLEVLLARELGADDVQRLKAMRPEATDVSHILPSGGTTGLPKLIPRTHNDYLCNVEYVARAVELCTHDTVLVVAPVGHNQALLNGTAGSIFSAAKLVLLDSTRPSDICRMIQQEKVTYMPIVPSLLKRIVEFDDLTNYDLSSLKYVMAGGEASTPELIKAAYARIGCGYFNGFGMSEGLIVRTRRDDDFETICHTVGRPCCPYDQVRILNDEGHELPANTDGELVAKGPCIFAGYLKNPEENSKAFTADGFFRTGDLARRDEAGNIKITGRIKDIIIRGGENISPNQVEELLLTYPGIADAAVIGMPDTELGERVCAYIKPVVGAALEPDDITAFLERWGASKLLIPERFVFTSTLPMTEAGKHDKKRLREDIKQRLEQS